MKREDFNDIDDFSEEEEGDFEVNEDSEIKQKVAGRDKKRENKRRRLDDLLEAKQLRADLGQFEAEAWSNDSYYDDILKEDKKKSRDER